MRTTNVVQPTSSRRPGLGRQVLRPRAVRNSRRWRRRRGDVEVVRCTAVRVRKRVRRRCAAVWIRKSIRRRRLRRRRRRCRSNPCDGSSRSSSTDSTSHGRGRDSCCRLLLLSLLLFHVRRPPVRSIRHRSLRPRGRNLDAPRVRLRWVVRDVRLRGLLLLLLLRLSDAQRRRHQLNGAHGADEGSLTVLV